MKTCSIVYQSRLRCSPSLGQLFKHAHLTVPDAQSSITITGWLPPWTIDHRIYPVTTNANLNSHLSFPDLWDRREYCFLAQVWWSLTEPTSLHVCVYILYVCVYILWNQKLDMMLLRTAKSVTAKFWVIRSLYNAILKWKQASNALSWPCYQSPRLWPGHT